MQYGEHYQQWMNINHFLCNIASVDNQQLILADNCSRQVLHFIRCINGYFRRTCICEHTELGQGSIRTRLGFASLTLFEVSVKASAAYA